MGAFIQFLPKPRNLTFIWSYLCLEHGRKGLASEARVSKGFRKTHQAGWRWNFQLSQKMLPGREENRAVGTAQITSLLLRCVVNVLIKSFPLRLERTPQTSRKPWHLQMETAESGEGAENWEGALQAFCQLPSHATWSPPCRKVSSWIV